MFGARGFVFGGGGDVSRFVIESRGLGSLGEGEGAVGRDGRRM